ncbi:MAG: radical SAM protein [Planctomycetes bacterium]|nr:radical SAM protein [Planctomycetota bacterium]
MKKRVRQAYEMMKRCSICPRRCAVNRLEGETGFCGTGAKALVSSAGPHYGEERPLVGRGGSGTIFFAGCNLGCVFCQNYDISHHRRGQETTPEALAKAMRQLERAGCHNINFVTPTHVTPQIMEAIVIARENGLKVPIVYNCGGYESLEVLRLLDGFIQIYMPDAKYASGEMAKTYSRAADYPEVNRAALKEMHRQVGDLVIRDGVATGGLLVRHLVMPNDVAGSKTVIDFLADEISPNTYVNVMDQYRPVFKAGDFPSIDRHLHPEEFAVVYRYAQRRGLRLAD